MNVLLHTHRYVKKKSIFEDEMDCSRVEGVTSPQARSLTEGLYRALRTEILSGRFAAGQRLRPGELSQQRGVSLNVVREALNRLSGEGLVDASPQLGFAVVQLSVEDLDDLTALRSLVECSAIRTSVEQGSLGWETELVAAHHRLARTPMTRPDGPDELTPEWMQAHNDFHAATMSACGNRRMIALTAALSESAAIYRHWSRVYDHGSRDIADEHRAIFEAALARDAELTGRLHAGHIRRTADIVIAAPGARELTAARPGSA
jgi:DNA-binding GntR family transcriptional regulator